MAAGVKYVGGVVGEVYNNGSEFFKVMIVNVNITGSGREAHVGGVAGKMRSVRIKEVYIGNTIVKVAGQKVMLEVLLGIPFRIPYRMLPL
ncbi:MAG: hypothetical protein QS721_15730 [Candidatus Endonucleobacter sp. (ex Gigantidas childressi)]|nr:hypothetical protein [Candidatus Endonucleobacter sp. (ex Gigantidas childressi)]